MAEVSGTAKSPPRTFDDWWKGLGESRRAKLRKSKNGLVRLLREAQPRHRKDLNWWFRVGTKMNELFRTKTRYYDSALIESLADMMPANRVWNQKTTVNFLYQVRKFAQVYRNKQAVKDLDRLCKSGQITLQHVRYLLTVEKDQNNKTRSKFLEDALAENWSANELYRQIQDDKSSFTRFGGRPPQAKSDALLAARDISRQARSWKHRHKVYFSDNDGFLTRNIHQYLKIN